MIKSAIKYLEKMPLPLLLIDKAYSITWINQFFLSKYNLNSNHIIGKSFDAIFQLTRNNQIISIKSKTRNSQILEVKLLPLKQLGWFKVQKTRFKAPDSHQIILFTDVSEYINDIQERVNSELNYQSIFQNAPYSNVLLSLDGSIIDVNQKTAKIFELPTNEMIGKRYADLINISEDLYNFYENIAEQIRNGKESTPFQTEIDTLKGNHKFLEIFPSLIRKNNEPNSIHLIIHDLTEEKRTKEKLSEQISIFAAFMENFAGVAFIKDPEGKYIYLNKTLLNLINENPNQKFTYNQCLGKTDFDLFPAKDAKQFLKNDLHVLNTQAESQVVETTTVNETVRYWLVNKFLIYDIGKKPWAVAGMGVNITDRKESEVLLEIQSDFGISLNQVSEKDQLFKLCINSGMKFPEIDLIGIYLYNTNNQRYELRYNVGASSEFVEKVKSEQFRRNNISLFENKKPIYRDFKYIKSSSNKTTIEEGIRSYCLIPIIVDKKVIGAFNVASRTYDSISQKTGNIIEIISSQLGATLAKIDAQKELKLNENRLEALLELNQIQFDSEDEIYNFALEKGVMLTNSTHGFIAHVDPENVIITKSRIWSSHSKHIPPKQDSSNNLSDFLTKKVWMKIIKTKKPIIMNSKEQMGDDFQLFPMIPREIFRYIAVPIFTKDRLFAVAGLWNKEENYVDSDVHQLTLLLEGVGSFIQKKLDETERERYRRELEKTVEEIKLNEHRLEVLLKLNQMTEESEDTIFDYVLREGVNLTRSESGFLSFISNDGKMKTMRVWTKHLDGESKIFDVPKQYQTLNKGVWGEIIHDKKPIIVNNTSKSKVTLSLLPSNQQVNRYILIPIMVEKRMYAVAAFSNKPDNYVDSDLKQIQLLIDAVVTIVQKKQDEEQREYYRKEIEKTEKINALGILAGGIAHDFNNILTAVLGNISLAELSVTEESKARLNEAKKAIIRSKELTQQLLTFAKGGTPIKKLSSIGNLLKETADFALRGSNVKIEYDIQEDLWAAEIDEGQISQVVNNLVINAIQAMPNGGIIQLKAYNKIIEDNSMIPLPAGPYITFSLRDEGVGIPEKFLNQIFDPYFTTKKEVGGSGLGLATSYAIITKHDGYISVKSKVGEGSTFSVSIPAILIKQPEVTKKMTEELVYGTGHVLVMDDEEIIRKVAKRMLEKLGYEVTTTIDGVETLEVYKKAMESRNPFDVVILDLTIPGGMGGKECILKLKEIDPKVKAIVASGYSVDPIMGEFKEYGFSGIITKPWRFEDFGKVIYSVIHEENI